MVHTFHLELVSPVARVFSDHVEQVVIPGEQGDFGVLAGHCVLVSMIRAGVLEVHLDATNRQRYFIGGGYANVAGDTCTVLAESLYPVESLQHDEVAKELEDARAALAQAEDLVRVAKARKVRELEAKLAATQKN